LVRAVAPQKNVREGEEKQLKQEGGGGGGGGLN